MDTSESEIEFDYDHDYDHAYDYDPTYEMILKDLEQGGLAVDDDSSGSSIPPPPPPARKSRRGAARIVGLCNKDTKEQDDDDARLPPVVHVRAEDVPVAAIEVEAVGQDWRCLVDKPSRGRSSRCRRVGFMCLAFMLVFAVLLGLVVRAGTSDNIEESSSFAEANTGAQDPLVTGGSSTTTTPSPSMSPTTTASSTNDEGAATVSLIPSAAPTTPGTDTATPTATTSTTLSTPAPTEDLEEESCNSLITSDESCYAFQSEISIIFENCSPEEDDWIGIWPIEDATDLSNLPEPTLWLWACGSQDCAGQVLMDTLPFGGSLPVGTYVAHMVRLESTEAPYSSSYAISSAFGVSLAC